MSLSDFSISSPRKTKPGDKSLTYDEDFENFLNDETSESEFSSSKFKKQKPWWMNDKDDKQTSQSFASAKSFLKKSKPEIPKLKTTYETNEPEDKNVDTARSLNNYSEEFDEEISKKSSPSIKSRKSTEKNESDNESTERASLSPKSNKLDESQEHTPQPTLLGTTPNLLSKVMFVDSLESGLLGPQTLKQINETSSSGLAQNSKMDTQTRQDLDELQAVYRNLATHSDSGLNTMNKTDNSEDRQNEKKLHDEMEEKNVNIAGYDFELDAVSLVKKELEKRILDQVVEEIEPKNAKSERVDLEAPWPPRKYRHVRSTGYGTTWKSKTAKQSQLKHSTITLRPYFASQNSTRDDTFEINFEKNNQTIQKLQDQLIKCADDYEQRIREMRKEYEKQLNELRTKLLDVTNQLNEKFSENFKKRVTFEDSELDDEDRKKTIEEQREKMDLLEKSLKEQEELMKGYQKENERLYNEMKKTKQDTQKHVSALEEEKKQLKLDLIQERLQEDNKKSIIAPETHKSFDNLSKVILPITEQTCPESLADKSIQQLTHENLELKKIVDFYEKNQQQIEQDVKVIDQKNKQIKKLNDKMQKIQMNKTGPDFVREITRLKKQLQEMDLVIKRMRQAKKSDASPINLSIDYYEQRIQDLEAKLKDKSLDVERLSRMWHQKMFLYKKLRDQESGVVSRDRDLSPLMKKMDQQNHEKICHLEALNQNLRNSVKNLEDQICDKEREMELLKSSNAKSYEPSDFVVKQEKVVDRADLDSMRHVYSQIENLKIKLCKKENELVLAQRDHEHKIEQIKNLNWKQWEDLSKKHRAEMEKLLSAFTGAKITLNGLDGESVFDDPIKFRLLIEACNRSKESQAKIGKLGQINKQLSQKCVYLESLVQRLSAGGEKNSEVCEESAEMGRIVTFYENQLRVKNDEIEKFRNELDTMLKILQSLNS